MTNLLIGVSFISPILNAAETETNSENNNKPTTTKIIEEPAPSAELLEFIAAFAEMNETDFDLILFHGTRDAIDIDEKDGDHLEESGKPSAENSDD